MICPAASTGLLELSETVFVHDVLELLVIVSPGAICLTLWRIFITNRTGPRGGIVSLGLDDSSLVYDIGPSEISHDVRLAYCLTALSTFALGCAVSNVCKFLSL